MALKKRITENQSSMMFGEPVGVRGSLSRVWIYLLNNLDARSFIPYYGEFHQANKRRHSGTIFFDANGRVKDFNWNESNPRGATIFR
jgi:hypothetical protein